MVTHLCHICGLPFVDAIKDPNHHLFRTKDHRIPISMGFPKLKGVKTFGGNLAPVHRYCNGAKGNKLHVRPNRVRQIRRLVVVSLLRLSNPITDKEMQDAVDLTGIPWNIPPRRMHYSLESWENEGGSTTLL